MSWSPSSLSGTSLTAEGGWLPTRPLRIVSACLLSKIAIFVPLMFPVHLLNTKWKVVILLNTDHEFCLPSGTRHDIS